MWIFQAFEAQYCIDNGAEEIDMVLAIGLLKAGHHDRVRQDVEAVAKVCHTHTHRVILKVILETCLLTKEEIRTACQIALSAGADFVKTSTGFSSGGATEEDVQVMSAMAHAVGKWCKVMTLHLPPSPPFATALM